MSSPKSEVIGFKSPDEKWRKMKAIWDACNKAEVQVPNDVLKYFNYSPPDERGVEVELKDTPCCTEYKEEMCDGFEIDMKKLPPDLTHIRFYISY